jgi:oligosaccharide repeat unit polymerase
VVALWISEGGLVSHPAIVFALSWAVVAMLATTDLAAIFNVAKVDVISVTGMVILCCVLGSIVGWRLVGLGAKATFTRLSEISFRNVHVLLPIWVVITILEIVLSGGVPIVWIVQGSSRTYEHFGIPTLHGFANAIWLYLAFACVATRIARSEPPSTLVSIVLLLWPVIAISRALATILAFACFIFYLLWCRPSVRFVVGWTCLFSVGFIALFGLIGDIRASEYSIQGSLEIDTDMQIPSGIYWIFAYMASPVSNLVYNFDVTAPQYNLIPINLLMPILPSVFRRALGIDTGFEGYLGELSHPAFNVSTAFMPAYMDAGVAGVCIFAFLIGLSGHFIWAMSRSSPRLVPLLSFFHVCVILTVFSNQFFQIPIIFVFVLLFFGAKYSVIGSFRRVIIRA